MSQPSANSGPMNTPRKLRSVPSVAMVGTGQMRNCKGTREIATAGYFSHFFWRAQHQHPVPPCLCRSAMRVSAGKQQREHDREGYIRKRESVSREGILWTTSFRLLSRSPAVHTIYIACVYTCTRYLVVQRTRYTCDAAWQLLTSSSSYTKFSI
jgi:hypothetical protein